MKRQQRSRLTVAAVARSSGCGRFGAGPWRRPGGGLVAVWWQGDRQTLGHMSVFPAHLAWHGQNGMAWHGVAHPCAPSVHLGMQLCRSHYGSMEWYGKASIALQAWPACTKTLLSQPPGKHVPMPFRLRLIGQVQFSAPCPNVRAPSLPRRPVQSRSQEVQQVHATTSAPHASECMHTTRRTARGGMVQARKQRVLMARERCNVTAALQAAALQQKGLGRKKCPQKKLQSTAHGVCATCASMGAAAQWVAPQAGGHVQASAALGPHITAVRG